MKHRGLPYFLPDNISFAEVPGLEREMRDHITMDLARRGALQDCDVAAIKIGSQRSPIRVLLGR